MHETDAFEAERPRLTAVAARILGGSAEAEDVVQEAWLRWSTTEDVDEPAAWLTTVVTRLCLDHLRKRGTSTRTSDEFGSVEAARLAEASTGPEEDALLADRVGEAMQVVIDTLAPPERVAFVLHDVFGYPFDDVAAALGRSGAGVRQLASRARRKVQDPAAAAAERTAHREVVGAFLAAARGGDLDTLLELLAPDAVMTVDAAGLAMGATEHVGAAAVAARFNGARGALPVTVDGYEAAAWIHRRELKVAFLFSVEDGLVCGVETIADPDALALMDVVTGRRARIS